MPRYFIELSYRGERFSGFQIQENAVTVQSEVESAFAVLHRRPVSLTGSSRTDAGVHALQNYFHFDDTGVHPQFVYKMNAILPRDIVIRALHEVPADAHSRFDAVSRRYLYRVHRFKNPFLQDRSLYYPYGLNRDAMQEAAAMIREQREFFAFAKSNSGVKHYECRLQLCEWEERGEEWLLHIEGNRFLRGMVRLITGTMLRIGRGRMSLSELEELFTSGEKAGFSVSAHGLFLVKVDFAEKFFPATGLSFTGF